MTRSLQTSRCSPRSGAAVVEMALVLPIFLMVLWAIIEFGRAMMVGQLVTQAARYGARQAILDGSTDAVVIADVKQFLKQTIGGITDSDVTVSLQVTAAPGNPNPVNTLANAKRRDECRLTVSVPYNRVGYIAGSFLKNAQLRGACSMRHE